MTDIVPFGKYRGQPIEALAADRDYCDWLMAQPWFRDRYQNVYTIIVNNQQPTETPEHNALQVLFLDQEYRLAFVRAVYGPHLEEVWLGHLTWRGNERQKLLDQIEKLKGSIADAKRREDKHGTELGWWTSSEKLEAELEVQTGKLQDNERPEKMLVETTVEFESQGIDVLMKVTIGSSADRRYVDSFYCGVEIKPSVGDDFPAVLRQMRHHLVKVLFLEKYTGVGATEQQFRKLFAASGKRVVFRREVEAEL